MILKLGEAVVPLHDLNPNDRKSMWIDVSGAINARVYISLLWLPGEKIKAAGPGSNLKASLCHKEPRLRIKLDRKTYYTGEHICGKVKLDVGAPIVMKKKGLFIRFRGKEVVDTTFEGREIHSAHTLINKATPIIPHDGVFGTKEIPSYISFSSSFFFSHLC